jgi:O-antigen ligase
VDAPLPTGVSTAARRAPSKAPGRRPAVFAVALLLVVATVGWRRGSYFAGSLDPVVLTKASLSLLALALAFLLAQSAHRRRLGTASLWWLGVVLGSSVIGALATEGLVAGGTVAVRVAVLTAAVFFLLRAAPSMQVLTGMVAACGVVALVAAGTGLATLGTGRLAGGIPALSPNELSLLAGVVVLYLAWRIVHGESTVANTVTAVVFLGVIWATESRTGLLMVLLGCLVIGAHLRRARVGLVVTGLVLGAGAAVAAVATGIVSDFVARNGDGISTLESRFIAWRAATDLATTGWQQLFGGGLALKVIPVRGQWWDEQPLDSSWVSLLVQAGMLGLVAALLWALWVVRGARRAPRKHRVLFLGLLVFLLGRSVVESGLFDATPAFLFFLMISLLVEGGSREGLAAEAAKADPADAQALTGSRT